jgi:hypothetical protein
MPIAENIGLRKQSSRKEVMADQSPLTLAVGASGRFAGMVVPELEKRGAMRSPHNARSLLPILRGRLGDGIFLLRRQGGK